ncbi:LysR family transcriptional regulator [Opitutus sp. ER46]|uniref:LysR family transcriptional regulator n=1 Tax=Opitutus sp. ER46 TaxID=2161864 RepID=UPI000D323C21|nr:LysR family transcriptional regulator [Opitutus sp. ER46]PTX96642.1 hypothetical protein DB354_08270 [Opitutus sp. ER46]
MELRHLRYFKAVAELLNFSRAAERLNVGQPALSRQIRDLENELGARLLDRSHVRVQLTDAGRTFYTHTCKILAQVDIATASVHQTLEGLGGELIICNDWRLSSQFVLGAIAEFRATFPQVEVNLRDLHVHEQLTALRTRQAHLGFLVNREVGKADELRSMHLQTAQLLVAVGAQHRFASRASIKMAELEDETWLLAEDAPGLREFISQLCRMSGFSPRFARPVRNVESLIARAAMGFGVCLMPDFAAAARPNAMVRFLPSDCPPLEVSAAWHAGETSRLLEQFLGILKHHLAAGAPVLNFNAGQTGKKTAAPRKRPQTGS